jgi:hypothetical protein
MTRAAEVDQLRRERDMWRDECASISEELGLPPTIRPAEGELRRMLEHNRALLSDVARLTHERDDARADVAGLRRLLDAVSAACQPASADELDAARMEVELARAWSRLWHREALRLWREVQALGGLRGLAADVAARRDHRVADECCSMCRLALALGVRVGE